MAVLMLQRAVRHPSHTPQRDGVVLLFRDCKVGSNMWVFSVAKARTMGERESWGPHALRPTILTHPLRRESPQSAEVLSFRKQKLIESPPTDKAGWFPPPHPTPVLLEIAGSTFANKKIVSIQFLVDWGALGTDPTHRVCPRVFLPGSSF